MLQVLGPAGLRAWCEVGLECLTLAREEIDGLNVYPVPDGDTGTNLQLTVASVVEALRTTPDDSAVVDTVVRSSLMGARGNSGVILSQLLRGFCQSLGAGSAAEVAAALRVSAEGAYTAVAVPVEGTVLTVAREAALAAQDPELDLAGVVREALLAARASLTRTPDLLPVLREAGVVDAGGRGWCVLLEALEQVVTGAVPEPAPIVPRSAPTGPREAGSTAFGYEVQYLLEGATDDAVGRLRGELGTLGDSLVVVGADGLHTVHVHVNDVGAALEAGVRAGRPFRVGVTRFAEEIDGPPSPVMNGRPGGRRVVAVVQGDGSAELFRRTGAVVVEGGPGACPSTAELLAAVRDSGAGQVVVLPNDGDVRAVADAAAEQAGLAGLEVLVVPTLSVLQGLAALSVADGSAALHDDVACMTDAAGATRWAEVTTAARDATTPAGPCRAGDVLGRVSGVVVTVGSDAEVVAAELLRHLLQEGGEVVTVLLGSGALPGAGGRLAVQLADRPVEVVVIDGGQPLHPFLLGVE